MLNLNMCASLVTKVHFALNRLILQFRPFFHFDNQSHCWLIFSEDDLRVKKSVKDLKHENVV